MIVRRITEPTIAQCAYLIACPRTRRALLVDPVRDPVRNCEIAKTIGVTLMAVLETHSPSDYLSGVSEMLCAHSVRAFLSGETAPPRWYSTDPNRWSRRITFLKDGDTFEVGDLRAHAILTPGHASGALSIWIEHPQSGVHVVLTGDALLPGGAGRAAEGDEDHLRDSLRRLSKLPDDTVVLAGHTSGSFCGRAVKLPGETTLQIERRFNRVLQTIDCSTDFARSCSNQPERPTYFAGIERMNNSERTPWLHELDGAAELDADRFLQLVSIPRTVVVDTRPWNQFTLNGSAGSLHLPLDRFFASMIAAAVRVDERVVFICEPTEVSEIVRASRLVGIDRIDGWISVAQYAALDHEIMDLSEVDEIAQHAAHALFDRRECCIIDVRTTAEWLLGRIAGARLMTVSQISDQLSAIPTDQFVIVYCGVGARSTRACAFLQRRGFRCASLRGGYWPWFGRGFPVEGVDQQIAAV
ncbi:MAG: MBL fold metallo-hydrolase [Phycisphaerales bacterium]|nr:MBL fold metallo-hydrolase [Phycisphaerales bacterium]